MPLRDEMLGIAMSLLPDLARKPVFLHDESVTSLEDLFDASRGPDASHPFYVQEQQRAAIVAFLRSLDTERIAHNR